VRLLDRLGTSRLDAALAAAFTVVGLAQAIAFPIADGVVGELFVLGTTLPLAWRRTRPVESTLVASAFFLTPLDGFPILGFVVVILQFFALGTHGVPRRAVVLTTAFASVTSVLGTFVGPEAAYAAIGGVLVVVAPVLAGRLVRHLRHQNDELTRLTAELREERARAEEAAVGAERARIAQELHDVVGHEVTLIAIQAEAATAALTVSPDRAAEPVEAIRTTAHRTLTEIRSVLDVLSPVVDEGGFPVVEDGPLRASLETTAWPNEDLASLASRAETAGIPNTVTVTGTPVPDEAPASLAVRRIVRECLTNAGRHASGAPVTIAVTWDRDAVCVEATNPTDTSGPLAPGRGLTGMRHRAELLGGTFSTDTADQAFTVRVRIPTGSPR
jgi:signal transduction histidine kinase